MQNFDRKHMHAQQAIFSFLLRNLYIVSQDHFGVFLMLATSFLVFFDIVSKHGIICFTGTSSPSLTLKFGSKYQLHLLIH